MVPGHRGFHGSMCGNRADTARAHAPRVCHSHASSRIGWPMRPAGIDIADEAVLDLARLLRRGGFTDTAESLEGAVAASLPDVAPTILERAAIVWVLGDPPGRRAGRAPRRANRRACPAQAFGTQLAKRSPTSPTSSRPWRSPLGHERRAR